MGDRGEDVRCAKGRLLEKGYYAQNITRITHDRFGSDTKKAVETFQKKNGLKETGTVNEETWVCLFAEEERVLKYLMRGEDVRKLKETLFSMGFYSEKIKKITNDRYGADTVEAVKNFQRRYRLNVDGITGKNTWAKLKEVSAGNGKATEEFLTAEQYPRIAERARETLNLALGQVSGERRKIVLEALKYVTDASVGAQYDYPSSLYIRGGNLYNRDLTLNVITESYLTGSYKRKYASYVTNGRLELMLDTVKANSSITGADCSGGIVGLLRYLGYAEQDFDDTANGLCGGHSQKIAKTDLIPGDFVGREGHICLYAGGGYMAEWVGGEFGAQLTNMNDHRAWSFTKKKYIKQKACTKYRRPKFYA